MQFLRNLIEKQRQLYHAKDSKFHKAWPLFDAFETFLFAPEHRAGKQGVHVRDYVDLKRVMNTVIIAMLPCLLWAIWNTGAQHFHAVESLLGAGKLAPEGYTLGWLQALLGGPTLGAVTAFDTIVFGLQRMLPILIVSYGVGLGIEMVFSVIRSEEVSEGYLVSGMLIALIVPASIPLWQLAVGVAFAVILGKEVFGGTGMNIFNPAMMVRAFLFFSFAAQMSGDQVWVAGNNSQHLIDGYSSPTALAIVKPSVITDASATLAEHFSRADLFFGNIPGSAGEMSKLAVLLGAFWLIFTGVGSWRVMLAGVLGMLGIAFVMHGLMPASFGGPVTLSPVDHLLVGGFLFGLVFMATDPVSSPETNTGKWIYGVLIGVVTFLVRAVNPAYPEGTMLSILLLNAFAPTIDHFVVAANIKRRLARS
ncbi:MAG: NADH:ubiquinone reductase (Na(+)-transporting) subunit B [Planctomycetes bacterium]|nr:NADH:ubiquinone reductase (Na(+)-transporting) subunit B [Planctomycetota bacterium]MCB9887472.1 NADH:ubiquinone reductase (Na(+)-transporting) subunit B [Planctomycetota bacterium]